MQRIAVVCGAGASSTFLVHWMRKIAAADSLPLVISANSLDDLTGRPVDADVVLLGSHLASELDAVTRSTASGVRVVLLPPLGFDAAGAAEALRLARSVEPSPLVTTRPTDQDRT